MNDQPNFTPLKRGATIGILGDGQLGRMLCMAASRLGYKTHVYGPNKNGPAVHVCSEHTVGPYEDLDGIHEFAKNCDNVTYEFENVPEFTAKAAMTTTPLRPGLKALKTAQDRLVEKTFLRDTANVPVAGFEDVNNCLLYTSPSPRDQRGSRMPSSA